MILNALERKPLPVYGQGLNVRDWLHVEDHCEAIWAVIERGQVGETYNIGGNSEQRNIDVVKRICALVADETRRERGRAARADHLRARPARVTTCATRSTPRKVERECGWRPKETFETGLRRTVRWYLENRAWVDGVRTGDYKRWLSLNYDGALRVGPCA